MAIPRASSGMLRSQIRPASRRAAPHLRAGAGQQVRNTTKVHGKDDLGGPGGQEPRPSKQAGPETIKRNWPAIGGAALLAVGGFVYLSGSGPSKADQEKLKAKTQAEAERLKQKGEQGLNEVKTKGEQGLNEAKLKGQEGLRKIEGKDGGAVGELSGRKGGMGGFRGE